MNVQELIFMTLSSSNDQEETTGGQLAGGVVYVDRLRANMQDTVSLQTAQTLLAS